MQQTRKQKHKRERKINVIGIGVSLFMITVGLIYIFTAAVAVGIPMLLFSVVACVLFSVLFFLSHKEVLISRRKEYSERDIEVAKGVILVDNDYHASFTMVTTTSETAQKPRKIYLRTDILTRNRPFSELKDIRLMCLPSTNGQLLYSKPISDVNVIKSSAWLAVKKIFRDSSVEVNVTHMEGRERWL
jgi:hypothetical protein